MGDSHGIDRNRSGEHGLNRGQRAGTKVSLSAGLTAALGTKLKGLRERNTGQTFREGAQDRAEAAGFSKSTSKALRKIVGGKSIGDSEAEMDQLIAQLQESDDSNEAAAIFDFLSAELDSDSKHRKVTGAAVGNAKAAFVTGSSGPTLQAAGLLEQLGAGQSGLNNGG